MSTETATATALATATGEDTPETSDEHSGLRDEIKDLRRRVEEGYWQLSVGLAKVYDDSLYLEWGFEGFREYVEDELDFRLRKAQYLVSIQNWFGQMTPTIQKWIQSIGWTKAKELVGIVTPENAASWKRKLKGKSFSQMLAIIQKNKEDESGGEVVDADAPEKAARKGFSLFPGQMETVEAAIAKAKEMSETDKDGNAITLICTDFLSTNQGIDTVQDMLGKIEKATGLRLIAWDPKEEEVVHGSDLVDELTGDDEAEGEEAEGDEG